METDKIYTCLSADMVRKGSRGYFADDLETLEKMVHTLDSRTDTHLLMQVNSKNAAARFKTETEYSYCLFYLVSLPPEPHTRPYMSGAELLADFESKKQPLYVFQDDTGNVSMITGIDSDAVWLNSTRVSFADLRNYFCFKNGDAVGVIENAE